MLSKKRNNLNLKFGGKRKNLDKCVRDLLDVALDVALHT